MPVEVAATLAALDRLAAAIDRNTALAVKAGADREQELARAYSPHRDPRSTGQLAESITVTGPYPTGAAEYTAKVGPTTVYGRIREWGGTIPGPKGMTHPFLRWEWDGHYVYKRKVRQKGARYMLKATEEMRPLFRSVCASHWAEALRTV